MPKKVSLRKRTRQAVAAEQEIIEDLDLDVEDHTVVDDDVVHNRRRKSRVTNGAGHNGDNEYDERLAAVLPSDAHKLEGYDDDDDERGAHLEEENMARAANKSMRRQVIESDFDVGGISASAKPARCRSGGDNAYADASNVAPVMEAVERDYAALTSSERLAMVQKESPEMIKMLEEMKQYIAEVRELAKPLQELLFQRRVSDSDRNLVLFLETKVQLMLSYCMHATFYLLLKAEGKKVAGHPVIDNLVEIRVYLEKLFPLEEKLQYSLNRLLSGKPTAAAHLDALRPLQQGERGALAASSGAEGKKSRKQLEALREAEVIEKAELATMNRIHTKKSAAAAASGAVDRTAVTSALGYHEDEDQYFSKIAADDEDEDNDNDNDSDNEGLSLIERLRRRQRAAAAALRPKANGHAAHDEDEDEEKDHDEDEGHDEDEEDLLSEGEDDGEDGEYETLLAEENERRHRDAAAASAPRPKFVEPEVDRRKAGKRIEAHRGLTRPRPKDRKTPRTAQRRKYEKGMRIHKAQTRTAVPEPNGGFIGVQGIKSRVTQSTRL